MAHAKILIVEDDDSIRALCRELLEGEGYAVGACSNGIEALAFLDAQAEPCLILLDMLMPMMGGVEFMGEFSKRPHTIVPIPVYLVSSNADSGAGKKLGCCGFLKKPFNCDALLAIVATHCKSDHEKPGKLRLLPHGV